MELKTIQVGPFEVNCTVIARDGRAWIVDPGGEAERVVALVESLGCEAAGILLTHAHFDHIGAIPALEKRWPGVPVFVHRNDEPVVTHPFNQFPPDYPAIPRPENLRTEGWPEFIEVLETPGHTPGGVCYYLRLKEEGAKDAGGILFSGDTLFAGSVGRTDFPGGSMPTLMASLKKLTALPDSTQVIPGHGPETTIGREKKTNPFLQGER